VFAVLFAAGVVLIRTVIPETLAGDTQWVERGAGRLRVALVLMSLAGIASVYRDAGFVEVGRASETQLIMRYIINPTDGLETSAR